MRYVTTPEESQPSERAAGVLADEEVTYDLENDEIVNEEPSERAPDVSARDTFPAGTHFRPSQSHVK
ncbi:hypothetical protein PF003_g14137 [Phytophthora fragariae]|nr:hypothetical protein PF003_g14137 [Phytophthora fragariae]